MNPPPPSADVLLEHGAFLRGLARSLVADEQRAEDVVQETWMAVLRRPPPPGARLRAWLGAITRNLALKSRRTEERLRRREARVARPDRAAETPDVAERVEIQRRVAEAVAELSEPGRTAIVQRDFDGLSPSQIAQRQGVPVRTIESRLRRARETLRARLDASYGARGVWQAALLPVAGFSGTTLHATATSSAHGGLPTVSTLGTAAAVGVTVMNIKLVVGLVAVAALGAFFAGRELASPQAPAVTADTPADDPERGPLLGTDASAHAALLGKLAAAEAENARLRDELAALRSAPEGLDPAPAPHATPAASAVAAYAPAAHAQVLAAQDWAAAGEAITKLVPLLVKLEGVLRGEGDLAAREFGDIGRWNSPLQQITLDAQQSDVPGSGTNGVFTHPAVALNLIHAALAQANVPLSEGQMDQLRALGDRFMLDDERRRQAYTPDTLALEDLIGEAALKERFFASVDGILTPPQREILHPPAVAGRLGVDLFSYGVLLRPLAKPVAFTSRDDLGQRFAALLMSLFGFADEHREMIRDVSAEWARSFSDAELAIAGDAITRESGKMSGGLVAGWAPVAYARSAAEKTLALERALLDRLPAGSEVAKKVRGAPPYFGLPIQE